MNSRDDLERNVASRLGGCTWWELREVERVLRVLEGTREDAHDLRAFRLRKIADAHAEDAG